MTGGDLRFGRTNSFAGFIKLHGASSQAYPKKSFAISLATPVAFFGLRESPHWILNAAYIDRSLMRHKISYDLFRSLSTSSSKRFAAGSGFVEVQFNGRYEGVYLWMERIDRSLLELRAYQSNELTHACVYKAVDHAANFSQPGHGGYEQREPDPLVASYWQPLDEFNQFVSSASVAQFSDAMGGVGSRLDLDNAIDFHLLVLLTSNMDGITKNFMIARDRATNPTANGGRFFFVPWDYDATFGRNWNGEVVPATAWLSNHLFDRLLGLKDYRARFVKRWEKLREKEFALKTIHALMDKNADFLGEAGERNVTRWPSTGEGYPDRLTFAQDIEQMKKWIQARLDWLDGEIHKQVAPIR